MNTETRIVELIQDRERKLKRCLTDEEISTQCGIGISEIRLLKSSHINDIGCIKISDISKVAQYFNVPIEKFIFTNDNTEENLAKKYTSEEFKKLLGKSKYKEEYYSVDTLVERIGNMIDNYENLTVGIKQNFNVKDLKERVLVRFSEKNHKIKINNVLLGSAIKANGSNTDYEKIYDSYCEAREKELVENADDVEFLLNLVNQYI